MKPVELTAAVQAALAGGVEADVVSLLTQAKDKNARYAKMSEAEAKAAVDFSFRTVLATCTGTDANPDTMTMLVDHAITAAKAGLCPITTAHNLLEDMLETSVLDVCEKIFAFMEARLTVWTTAPFIGPSSMIPMLRICNALKKRLSKHQDTVFCGRILIFLASVTPLSDRSGVNQGSSFNLGNETVFEEDSETAAETKAATADAASENDRPMDTPVDFVFYRQFWTLQRFFCDPTQCYRDDQWKVFRKCSETVLSSFKAFRLDDVADAGSSSSTATDSTEYFAKFLTSSKLFRLQQSDSHFRRQILVQMLVLFQYLTGTVKFKKDNFNLSNAQSDWITKMQKTCFHLIKLSPPSGEQFALDVKRVLKSENHWVQWKNDGCPAFARETLPLKRAREKDADADADAMEVEDGASPAKKAKAADKLDLGSAELTRLWNITKTNLESCKADSRRSTPKTGEFFEEALEQIDPVNDVEKEYWSTKNPAYCWRALRLLGAEKLHYFQELSSNAGGGDSLSDYLEKVLQKHSGDLATEAK